MDKKELVAYLVRNCTCVDDETGKPYVDLNDLDFTPYDCDVDMVGTKVRGNLDRNCAIVEKGNLSQSYCQADGGISEIFNEAKKELD